MDISDRHQQEKKDLRDLISEMLKEAKRSKNKNAKKEAREEIIRLEKELKLRHEQELAEIIEPLVIDEIEKEAIPEVTKLSKAQRRRARKEEEMKQRKEEAMQEAEEMTDYKQIEIDQLEAKISSLGSSIFSIPADGHCMYRAIAHQLELVDPEFSGDFVSVRKMASEYISCHFEEFAGFIVHETSGDVLCSEEDIKDYAERIVSGTPVVWGGLIELMALSKSLERDIVVYSAQGSDINLEGGQSPPLRVSFHTHYYGLGPHYNSVVQ